MLAFDNRGVGRTDKPDVPYSIPMMADDTIGLMDELDIERARFVGISMGARIALDAALRHGERVSQLTFVSAQASSRGRVHLSFPMRMAWLLGWLPWAKSSYPQPRYALLRQREASLRYDCMERLPEVKVPTLILQGTKDRSAPYSGAEMMQRSIPGAQLDPFRGGHLIFLMAERERLLEALLDA